jgi:hypothetical protein
MPTRFFAVLAATLAACGHGEPFVPGEYASDDPFNAPPLVRLTLNPGADFAPAWMPDGSLIYSAQRLDRADGDRCFAILVPARGTIARYVCRSTSPDDSTNEFQEAAPSPAGAIAFVRYATHRFPFRPLTPDVQELVLAPLDQPNEAQPRQSIPYTLPGRPTHSGISHLAWLGSSRLVYLAEAVTYPRACSSCAPDTVRTGLEIVTLDFTNATPSLVAVPGTAAATSVSVGATGDTIYFTLAGDPVVYRRTFSLARTDTLYDFAATGEPAVGVAVKNGRLAAAVGNDLYVVDLAGGTETVFVDPAAVSMFRRPAFSPDGTTVAVEAWLRGGIGAPDIWLVSVP